MILNRCWKVFASGSCIMMLGLNLIMMTIPIFQEAGYKEVLEVERKSGAVEMKLAKITNEVCRFLVPAPTPVQVDGISKGHLDPALVPEALAKLTKRSNILNEEALRLLESLDRSAFPIPVAT
jgi:hypothetical protein